MTCVPPVSSRDSDVSCHIWRVNLSRNRQAAAAAARTSGTTGSNSSSSSKDIRHNRQQQQQQQGQQAAVAGTAGSSSRQELLVGKGALKPCPARIFSHPQLMKLPHKTLNKWWKSFAGGKRFVPRVATPHASSLP